MQGYLLQVAARAAMEPTQSYSLAQLEASFKVVPAVPGIPDRLTALEAVADSWLI